MANIAMDVLLRDGVTRQFLYPSRTGRFHFVNYQTYLMVLIVESLLVLETVQQLRALAALVKDLNSVPNMDKVACNHL